MKFFISFSGKLSCELAKILKEWLNLVIQNLEIFISDDIPKGASWFEELKGNLENTKYGIICLTHENLNSPWINFEAGAFFARGAQLSPVLYKLEPAQLKNPLNLLQATKLEEEEMWDLIKTINNRLDKKLPEPNLKKTFDKWWPNLEKGLDELSQNEDLNKGEKKLSSEEKANLTFKMVQEIKQRMGNLEKEILGAKEMKAEDFKSIPIDLFMDKPKKRELVEKKLF